VTTQPTVGARTALCTVLALTGFAANSLLCRAALGTNAIDATSFTAIRIAAGAAVLCALAAWQSRGGGERGGGTWASALALVAYALPFALAYVWIGAGIGALILFGAVQATMLGWAVAHGERLGARRWTGVAIAAGGVIALLARGQAAPHPAGAALMAAAGVAWGAYSLRGRGAKRPLATTAGNFARAAPLALTALAAAWPWHALTWPGVGFAAASGALASGLGYALWYAALPHLSAATAAVVQLSVPVITAAAAVALLGERVTARTAIAAAAVLAGIALATLRRPVPMPAAPAPARA
jgi:drug/metabolite transporter (DMT)-like permease